MVSKEKLRETIDTIISIDGKVEFIYLRMEDIDTAEKCYNLYYSGPNRVCISNGYYENSLKGGLSKLDNIDESVDDIYEYLSNNIRGYIKKALDNLNLGDEDIKYFDRNQDLLVKFKNEVLKLKENDILHSQSQ